MKDEDDDNDGATMAVQRYPCMPSLVGLQQMRNRFQLAKLGRNLMKWTAQATGRQLRLVGARLAKLYEGFSDDMADAFLMLARAKYHCPHLNSTVINGLTPGIPSHLKTYTTWKSEAGVKIFHFEIVETNSKAFQLTGVARGGEAIEAVRVQWKLLLHRMINMLEERVAFMLIDISNKNATKRSNVLGKIVLPRTMKSVAYILSELEERAREDFFRMKKILEIKAKAKAQLQTNIETTKSRTRLAEMSFAELVPKHTIDESMMSDDSDNVSFVENPIELPMPPKPAIKECVSCHTPILGSACKIDDLAKLAALKAYLDEIVTMTKTLKRGSVTGIDAFIRTAERFKGHLKGAPIPATARSEDLCETCKMRQKFEQATAMETPAQLPPAVPPPQLPPAVPPPPQSPELTVRPPSVEMFSVTPPPPEASSSVAADSNVTDVTSWKSTDTSQAKSAYYETDEKQITQVVRRKNPDGTITEERKTIKIKREIKSPLPLSRQPSGESNAKYEGSKTVGMITYNPSQPYNRTNLSKTEIQTDAPSACTKCMKPLTKLYEAGSEVVSTSECYKTGYNDFSQLFEDIKLTPSERDLVYSSYSNDSLCDIKSETDNAMPSSSNVGTEVHHSQSFHSTDSQKQE